MMWSGFLDLLFVPYINTNDKFCSRDNDYPDILQEINTLIQNMCVVSLINRYSPSEALEHFNEIKDLILSKERFNNFVDESDEKVETSETSETIEKYIKGSDGKWKLRTDNISKRECKVLKKTVNPKCEDESHCIWVKGKKCIDKAGYNKLKKALPKLVSSINSQKKTSIKKACPTGKVLNPLTGNCIKTNGATAKQLRKEGIIN